MKMLGWLIVVLLIGLGILGLFVDESEKKIQELKSHSGQLSEHITYGPFTPEGKKSNVYFSLSGEDFRYRLSLPKGMEDNIDDLKKGATVELQYRDRADNKREVWEIALIGQSPMVTVNDSTDHRKNSRIVTATGFLLFGIIGLYIMMTGVSLLKVGGWALVGFCTYTGLWIFSNGDFQRKKAQTLKSHTGQISTEITYEYAIDGSGLRTNKKHKAIFSLSGEDFEYEFLLLPRIDDLDAFKKGDSVEMQYLDRPNNKRRVWEIAMVGQPPIVSIQDRIDHNEGKEKLVAITFLLFGIAGAYLMITKIS